MSNDDEVGCLGFGGRGGIMRSLAGSLSAGSWLVSGSWRALTMGAALLVAGCDAVSAPVAEAPNGSGGGVAWADWRPSSPVTDLPRLSEAEKMQMREELLASIAENAGISDPPEVELERWVLPTEWGPSHVGCFAELGFEVKPGSEGIGVELVGQVTGEQGDLLNLAHYICTARFFPDPDFMQMQTPDQIRVHHEYMVQMLVPCLKEQGFDPGEPPSLETYVATWGTSEWWDAFDAAGVGAEEYERVIEACPGEPPAAARYGERLS